MSATRVAVTEVEDVRWEPDPSEPPIAAIGRGYDPATGTPLDESGNKSPWVRILGAGLNLAHIAFKYGPLSPGQDPERTTEWRTPARGWLSIITSRKHPSRLRDYAQSTVNDAYEENDRWNELHTDELTGLPNRKRWLKDVIQAYNWVNEPIEDEKEREKGERALVVAFADLDGFKNLNDEKGHEAGDNGIVLFARQFASLLRHNRPGSDAHDLAARPHGDELLGNCRVVAKDIEEVVRRMIARFRKELDEGAPIINEELANFPNKNPSSDYVPEVRTSVGYAVLRRGDSLEDFLDRADTAMYLVKNARKNKLTEEEVKDWSMQRLDTAREMLAILAEMPGERRTYLGIERLIKIKEQLLAQNA